MTLSYTLTVADPKPTVTIAVPSVSAAADIINETIVWAKSANVQIDGWAFTLTA